MRKWMIITLYVLVFWILIPVLLLGITHRLQDSLNLQRMDSAAAGIVILLISVPLLSLSVWQYYRHTGNLPVSAFPPGNILRKGLYNYFRHPIYLFYDLTLAGIAFALGSRVMLFMVMPGFILLTYIYTRFEEKGLIRRFGDAYKLHRVQTGLIIPRFYQLVRFPLRLLFRYLFGLKIKSATLARLSPPFFIVAEHKNYLDPFFIAVAVPWPVSWLATYEVFRSPLLGWFMRRFCSIPRKRYRQDSASIRQLTGRINNGGVIGLFPEGERSWTGETQDFKPEVMKLLCRMHRIPVVPVRITGNYHAWPRWAEGFRRYSVTVEFSDPVYPESGCTPDSLEKMIKDATGQNEIQGLPRSHVGDIGRGLEKVFYRCSDCLSFNSLKTVGNLLECQKCGLTLKVSPGLSVSVQHPVPGKAVSIAGYYHSIRVTSGEPLLKDLIFPGENSDSKAVTVNGSLKDSGACRLFMENGRKFILTLTGNLTLTGHDMVFASSGREVRLPYEEISSITTESNFKLQIFNHVSRQLFQAEFINGSVLQWQDILTSAIFLRTGRTINTR